MMLKDRLAWARRLAPLGLMMVVVTACTAGATPPPDRLLVLASIAPLTDFVQQVGGGYVL